MKKSIFNISKQSLLLILGAWFMAACTPAPVDESKLFLTEQQANDILEKGIYLTLQEFKDTYMTEEGNYCLPELYRARSKAGQYYLFSIDTIPVSKTPIYIRGRVTTDDYAGNFYKTLCIQQIVNGEQQALRLSVDAGSIGGLYQIGQEILIRIDGLAIGRYANQPQLCLPSYNNNIYANKSEQKVGWVSGRIPIAIFKARTQCIGMPDISKLYYETLRITDFNQITDLLKTRDWDAKLIRIENVHFTGQYDNNGRPTNCTTGNPEIDEYANVFAPTTNNLNYPQSRVIYDSNNQNYTLVSTSEYAKFAHFYLPGADKNGISGCANYEGDVVGILGFYYDNGLNYSKYAPAPEDWSITIRSLDDLQLYNDEGNLWPRIEYTK